MTGAFTRFLLCGRQHTLLPYVIPPVILNHAYTLMFSYAISRGGTVPDIRPVTNIRVAPKWGKKKA